MEENNLSFAKKIKNSVKRIKSKLKLLKLIEKAKFEYDRNNYSGCEDACRKILAENPENSTALRGLGCVMQASGNNKKALEYYTKALNFSTNKELEYTLIGTIYYLEENLDMAIKYYNLAIDENEDYDKAYEGRNQAMLENHLKIIDLQESLIKRKIF